MPSDSDPADLNPNPIVALAMRIRNARDVGAAIESGTPASDAPAGSDAAVALAAFADALNVGCRRLNTILGARGVLFVRLENPLRIRLRFGDRRVGLDLDQGRQLVLVRGLGFDGEYQFDTGAAVPALINLSKLSTEAGYGDALTPSTLLKAVAEGAELPRPAHLDEPGPMRF
jgi:hypothetical protein